MVSWVLLYWFNTPDIVTMGRVTVGIDVVKEVRLRL